MRVKQALAVCLWLAAWLPPSAGAGMIKHVFIVEPPVDFDRYEAWYSQTHSQECLRYFGPWLRRYDMYRGRPVPSEAAARGVYHGRYLELWYDGVESWREAGPFSHTYSAPPWGSNSKPDRPTASLIVPAVPTENLLGREPPPKDRPYFRYVVALKYPEGASVEEAEKWYLQVHTQEAKKLPGLVRYVSYKAIPNSPAPSPWLRITELWYKDYEAWQKATLGSPIQYTPPPYPVQNRRWFDTVSIFVGDEPELDFLRDRPQKR